MLRKYRTSLKNCTKASKFHTCSRKADLEMLAQQIKKRRCLKKEHKQQHLNDDLSRKKNSPPPRFTSMAW